MQSKLQRALGGETEASTSRHAEPRQPTTFRTTTCVLSTRDPLTIFFSKYTNFDYDAIKSQVDPISEFNRLAVMRKWHTSGKKYMKKHRAFRVSLEQTRLLKSTHNQAYSPSIPDPLSVFFAQFPEFSYCGAEDGISPRSEFDRLIELRGCAVGSTDYQWSEKQFQHAVNFGAGDGHDPMSIYFAACPNFTYNAPIINARTAALEFERLCRIQRWTSRQESLRRTAFNNALKFVYGDDPLKEEVGSKVIEADIARLEEEFGGVTIREEAIPGSDSSPGPVIFTPSSGSGPIDDFFALYPTFNYNPSAPSGSEFQRLCTFQGLEQTSRRFRRLRAAFTSATGEELLWQLERDEVMPTTLNFGGERPGPKDSVLGRGEEDSKPWTRICEILNLRTSDGSRPKSITQCKTVLKTTFINIYDFVDYLRYGKELRRFPTLKALSIYSYKEDLIFGKKAAKKSELLKFLLQRISLAQSMRKD